MMPRWIEYPDMDTQAIALAERVAAELRARLSDAEQATLAVPGGRTPSAFLQALAQQPLDWPRLRVMLTDERFLPPDAPRSNAGLLAASLLQGEAADADFVPFYEPAERPEDVLEVLNGLVKPHLPLDVAVLGMGADMHIASLFPGADRLAEALDPGGEAVLLPMRPKDQPEARVTLTAPVFHAASHLHLLIAGVEKKKAVEKALAAGSSLEAPVRVLFEAPAPLTIHYCENPAGA